MEVKKYAVRCGNNEQRTISGTGGDEITSHNLIISFFPWESRKQLRHFKERIE